MLNTSSVFSMLEMLRNIQIHNLDHHGGINVSFRRRQWQATPVLLPRKSHRQRSLAGYSPWGRKESDTTEQLTQQHFIEEEMGF